jgi:REP element-mobilizing transposase RayT
VPNAERIFYLAQAFQDGMTIEEVFGLTKIDPWFLSNIAQVVEATKAQRKSGFQPDSADGLPAGRLNNVQAGSPPAESARMADFQFRAFDPRGEVIQKRRHLPHWEQKGATYFVTFRLADSVSAQILGQWREEHARFLKFHPLPWDWKTTREYIRLCEESREQWLDQGHGSCLLRERRGAEVVSEALRHFDGQRYVLDAFVVMPNHVHVLVKPLGEYELPEILHSWKSDSANALNRAFARNGAVWMEESFDTIVRDLAHLAELRNYIAENPRKAKLPEGEFVLENQSALVADEESRPAGSPSKPIGAAPNVSGFQIASSRTR